MIALNRKNALFAGSDEGAENWAMLASLIETCKLHGVNPEAYLTDVLTKLVNNWPNSGSPNLRLGAGLPHTDRRRRTKPAVKPFRSWPRFFAYLHTRRTRTEVARTIASPAFEERRCPFPCARAAGCLVIHAAHAPHTAARRHSG